MNSTKNPGFSELNSLQYKDMDDKPLDFDPVVGKRLRYGLSGPVDYQAFQAETQIGLVEIQGKRNSQEDRMAVGALAEIDLNSLTESEIKPGVVRSIQQLQNCVTDLKVAFAGSTLCTVLLSGDTIVTANAGDSLAFVCVVNELGEVTQLQQLNPILHNPTQENEKKRLEDKGHTIRQGRIGPSGGEYLAVSRSIGDNTFEKVGLLHDADFYFTKQPCPAGSKVLVITACDGLLENNCLTASDMAKIIEESHTLPVNQIAKKLAKAAYDKGSRDNISVGVTTLAPESSHTKYMAVFDGHGGECVADALRYLFHPILMINMQCAMLKKKNEQAMMAEETKHTLSQLILDVNDACLYLSKAFNVYERDLFSHRRSTQLQEYYEKYVSLLNNLLTKGFHPSGISQGNVFDGLVSPIDVYSQLILLIKKFEEMQQMYCPDVDEPVFKYPTMLIEQLLSELESNNADIIDINNKYQQHCHNMETLYQAAQQVFNARRNFDEKMPSTYTIEFFTKYKGNSELNRIASEIEEEVKKMFSQYPEESIPVLVQKLHDTLNAKMKNIPPAGDEKDTLKLFQSNPYQKFRECMETALKNIADIQEKMNCVSSKLN